MRKRYPSFLSSLARSGSEVVDKIEKSTLLSTNRCKLCVIVVVTMLAACTTSPAGHSTANVQTAASVPDTTTLPITRNAGLKLHNGKLVQEPIVLPATTREVDTLCDYLNRSRGLGVDTRSQEQGRTCRRMQFNGMNQRRLNCIQRGLDKRDSSAKEIETCIRQGQNFDQALQDKIDYDSIQSINSLAEFGNLSRRAVENGDRLGLLTEIQFRMNALCETSTPDFKNREEWRTALDLYQQAGTSGACAKNAISAQRALLEIDQSEQRAALANAKSWKQLDEFIVQYERRDTADLIAAARVQLEQARRDEIAAMRAMPLDDLERFWRTSPDLMPELRDLTRRRLMEESLAEKTFRGALRAYRVSGDISHIRTNQNLARTPDDRRRLEEIVVGNTSTPGRFFHLGISASHGQPSRDESNHLGILALYTMTGAIPIQGVVTVQRALDAPGQLALGKYRVHIEAVLKARMSVERRSSVLGNANGTNDQTISRRVTVVVGPPSMMGTASIDFGSLNVVRMQRGSAGGYDQEWLRDDPVVQVSIVGVDVIQGDHQ